MSAAKRHNAAQRQSRFDPGVLLALAAMAACTVSATLAADYPTRLIRYVVPSAAGSSPDLTARIVAPELSRLLGQPIVIDNRPGANSMLAMDTIIKAAPDGHTIGHGTTPMLALNYGLMRNWPYDRDKDMALVAQLITSMNLLAVTLSLPVKSVTELIDHSRKNPDKLAYATGGPGTTQSLAAELFKSMTGTRIHQVNYKAIAQGDIDLIAGRVQVIFNNLPVIAPNVTAGKVRGLAVTALKRSPLFPELPTVAEAGVPGYEAVIWAGIITPAGVPASVVTKLNTSVNQTLGLASVKEKLQSAGYETAGGTPAQFAAHARSEAVKWLAVIRTAGIQPQ